MINKIFNKLFILAIGFSWMIILLKFLGLTFISKLSWETVFIPLISFLIISLSYIVLTYFRYSLTVFKDKKMSFRNEKIVKRRLKNYQLPTRIKTGLINALILLISIIITYLLLK